MMTRLFLCSSSAAAAALALVGLTSLVQAHGAGGHHHHHHHDHNHNHGHNHAGHRSLKEDATTTTDTDAPVDNESPQSPYQCGFDQLNETMQAINEAEITAYIADHPEVVFARKKDDSDSTDEPADAIPKTRIPTWFHNIRTNTGTLGLTDSQILLQMAVLNDSFHTAGFFFDLQGVTTTDNSVYQSYVLNVPGSNTPTQAEARMKTELHQGSCDTLNIYSNLPLSSSMVEGATITGLATVPIFCQGADTTMDGVIINKDTAPGSGAPPLDEGKNLVHQVGHWLGLLHTFEGACSEPNDMVLDTAMADPIFADYFICWQEGVVDSCPDFQLDAVTNHMTFLPDACSDQFSDGQITRMKAQYNMWRKPTQTRAPSPSPSGSGSSGSFPSCFSKAATVSVLDQGPTRMDNLQVGDYVATATPSSSSSYQPIYAFAHRDTNAQVDFLRIHTAATKHHHQQAASPLEITKDHLIFLKGQSNPVRAGSIQIGDQLVTASKTAAIVTKIDTIQRQGLYAPLTADGTLIVDGIVTSCYVSLLSNSQQQQGLTTTNQFFISQHNLAHVMLSPVRMVCLGVSGSLCHTHNAQNGLANFVELGIALVDFYVQFQQTSWWWMQLLLSAIFLGICGPCYALECLFGPNMGAVALALTMMVALRHALVLPSHSSPSK